MTADVRQASGARSEAPGISDRFQDIAATFASSDRVLPTILQRQAARYGDRILLIAGDVSWTYTQAASQAAVSARALAAAGIKPGDRVAILVSNRAEFLEIYLGCAWLGAIAVPVNPALRGPQLQHIFRNSGPKLLVVEEIYRSNLDTVIEAGLLPALTWTIDASGITRGAASQVPQDEDLPVPRPGDTVAVLYTSGTTGPAKGVCCPQAQMFWWGIYSARALGIREGDVLLTTLPIFHTNALNAFYQALLNGCTYVLEPKFSASGFWATVRKHKANVTYLLGAMAAILLAQPESADDKDHSVRVALDGGVPGRFHDLFRERFGVPLVDGYGSTETNFVFASPIPSDRPGSMGYLADGVEARIVDANDAPLAEGEAGELILRAREPFAFATGYFGMPEKTVEAWRNLWFHSGDRVVRHASGHYYFIDRMKDAIRRRGENVSSWEVEDVIQAHPAVAACAVYPVPSELGEDEVAVAIQRKDGVDLPPLDLITYCEGRMAYFAVPRFIRFVDTMPLTENGKIKKVSLREAGITADMWDREKSGYKLRR
ncbi:ATP-dependent acyl-CoA ligase [Methylocella sp. CPCC 101449]|uniref:ATP-dependent acyl-CoA ligase n=1 Tax=Methylocella sp. CPCC 101449 TaxID=2987531 RepID=UPI0028904357|nr:ATP-dependent acyl-CoA ligase [Methylocella sp. CPCC 101449]MDT2020011.1 ATP-dependent acyl-CoA ligase [Methylocella sp. CPCC 101449]